MTANFHSMKLFLLSLSLLAATARADSPEKSIDLLDDKNLAAWELITPPTTPAALANVCKFNPDGSLAVAGKPVSFLASKASYDNYQLHAEWRWSKAAPKNSNGGILLHITSGPTNGTAWPVCFQMQQKPAHVGDLLPMHTAQFAEKLSTAPGIAPPRLERSAADSELPLGEWNTCDIICRGDRIEVTINGVLQNKISQCQPAAGKIGIQLEGTPFELRKLRLAPL